MLRTLMGTVYTSGRPICLLHRTLMGTVYISGSPICLLHRTLLGTVYTSGRPICLLHRTLMGSVYTSGRPICLLHRTLMGFLAPGQCQERRSFNHWSRVLHVGDRMCAPVAMLSWAVGDRVTVT